MAKDVVEMIGGCLDAPMDACLARGRQKKNIECANNTRQEGGTWETRDTQTKTFVQVCSGTNQEV
jgi:hypothetical protein